MSLLIKGINVKEIEHGAVAIINIDDVAYFVHGDNIVVISDHGDLIDRDELLKMDPWDWGCDPYEVGGVKQTIEEQPVIIPAERSE